jgi:lysophospholipase L1-like esterase
VGASHNSKTVSSILTKDTDTLWLNFGGRAYNSTQELIKLVLHMPKNLKSIIIFSGVNNLTLSHLSPYTSPIFNSFYAQSTFEKAVEHRFFESHIGVKEAVRRLLNEIKYKLFPSQLNHFRKSIDDSYANVLSCFDRDMKVHKSLANGISSDLYFVMQPLVSWLSKNLSKEEVDIFAELDSFNPDFIVLADYLSKYKCQYFQDIESICYKHGVKYLNLNECQEFESNQWIFADRVHLTDRGNQMVCDAIKRNFSI